MECARCLEPRSLLLFITLCVTVAASAMLCAAIMTDHWEQLNWDKEEIQSLISSSNITGLQLKMTRFLNDSVTKISVDKQKRNGEVVEVARLFLVPMHGGIWTLCIDLDEHEKIELKTIGIVNTNCINYLKPTIIDDQRIEEPRADWQHRMQNLSISCALVCLIILGSSALVGTFGVLKHQISAVLVTGVMYLLAGTFAMFTLTIIHFKRKASTDCSETGGDGAFAWGSSKVTHKLLVHFLPARNFSGGWSHELGWAALGTCTAASALWILLAKVMRYSPVSSLLT